MHAAFAPMARLTLCCAVALLLSFGARAQDLPDFTELVKEAGPAVVNVSATREPGERGGFEIPRFPGIPEDSPFNEFFRRFFEERPDMPPQEPLRSLGSGFIISEDGYILTNTHVVAEAATLLVRLNDGREMPAEIVGTDERSDVALLKVDAEGLPTVHIGDSDELEVGEWVLAIGSPFGLEHTATQGIVSAVGRSLPSETYVPFIQTDVAVNPGNSGGPLFNTDGEVVGINAQIFSSTGGYMGLAFAIPINVAMNVADQLRTQGYVTRGWLGVMIQPVERDLAEAFGMDRPRGALVAQVVEGSPAAEAGIQTGDVIVEFGEETIEQATRLPSVVANTEVGSKVPVTVLRQGRERTLTVTVGELDKTGVEPDGAERRGSAEARLNVTVTDVPLQQREQLGLGDRGVLVQSIEPGPAARAGVLPGDIILQINHQDVSDARSLAQIVRELPADKAVPLLVQRGQNPVYLALRMPGEEQQKDPG